jgi:hypothetical protein
MTDAFAAGAALNTRAAPLAALATLRAGEGSQHGDGGHNDDKARHAIGGLLRGSCGGQLQQRR